MVKVKVTRDMPRQAESGGGGIDPTHSLPGARRKWVVSTTLWPLYPQKDPVTIL
jgi:hypothetical protein